MKTTIITVSYNSEKTITRSIESILQQKHPHLEYIIVDDASKDRTVDIVHSYEGQFKKKV